MTSSSGSTGTDWIKPHLTEAPCLMAVFEQAWSLGADGGKRKPLRP